jgi:hypothetical protein
MTTMSSGMHCIRCPSRRYNFSVLMSAFRRHLASLGLTVALSHLVIQVLVPAALCCQTPLSTTRAAVADCCPGGSHPGQVCPMHASPNARAESKKADCHAQPLVDLHDLFVALTSGGVIPSVTSLSAPAGSEPAPRAAGPRSSSIADIPPGPPPRA